jgi:hypothetical protein
VRAPHPARQHPARRDAFLLNLDEPCLLGRERGPEGLRLFDDGEARVFGRLHHVACELQRLLAIGLCPRGDRLHLLAEPALACAAELELGTPALGLFGVELRFVALVGEVRPRARRARRASPLRATRAILRAR